MTDAAITAFMIDLARKTTEREREAQRWSFAYGNLACSTNHRPSRRAFENLMREKCPWTEDEIQAWLNARQWEIE